MVLPRFKDRNLVSPPSYTSLPSAFLNCPPALHIALTCRAIIRRAAEVCAAFFRLEGQGHACSCSIDGHPIPDALLGGHLGGQLRNACSLRCVTIIGSPCACRPWLLLPPSWARWDWEVDSLPPLRDGGQVRGGGTPTGAREGCCCCCEGSCPGRCVELGSSPSRTSCGSVSAMNYHRPVFSARSRGPRTTGGGRGRGGESCLVEEGTSSSGTMLTPPRDNQLLAWEKISYSDSPPCMLRVGPWPRWRAGQRRRSRPRWAGTNGGMLL